MDSEQPHTSMFKTILVGTALVLCSGFSCFVTLGSVNPAQNLYSTVAVPQGALRTTSMAPVRGLAPLQNVPVSVTQQSGSTLFRGFGCRGCWHGGRLFSSGLGSTEVVVHLTTLVLVIRASTFESSYSPYHHRTKAPVEARPKFQPYRPQALVPSNGADVPV